MVLNNLIGPVTGLLDKFIEDKDQKAALAHEIATMGAKHARGSYKWCKVGMRQLQGVPRDMRQQQGV